MSFSLSNRRSEIAFAYQYVSQNPAATLPRAEHRLACNARLNLVRRRLSRKGLAS